MRTMRRTAGVIAAATVAAATLTATLPATAEDAPYPGYTVLATVPEVTAQRTAVGSVISELAIHDGEIYVGYGDYDSNTGPIQVVSMNLETGALSGSKLSVPTEEIQTFRTINGALYAPMTDPKIGWTSPVGFATNASGTWENVLAAPMVHVYDVATLDGNDLWMAGSAYVDGTNQVAAVLYRTTDGGQTWNQVMSDLPDPATGYERYYWVAELNGKIYTQVTHYSTSTNNFGPVRMFDGSRWRTVLGGGKSPASVCRSTDPGKMVTFNDHLICDAGLGVNVFDGKKLERVDGVPHLRDVFATDTHAYIYTGSAVYRSADAHTWELVTMNTPSGAASLAVHDGHLYFGTYNEEIIISDLTVDDMLAGPRISALDGNGLVSGVQSDITITGTGFDQGATVTISGTTPIEYVNTDVSTDGTTIVATVIPGEITQKQYYLTLTVTNPDGQRVTSGSLWIDVAPVDDGGKVWNPNKPVK